MSNEAGRQAAHVFVDLVSAWDPGDPSGWQAVVDTAVPRLQECGALTVSVDDATGEVQLHLGDLVGGVSTLLTRLIREIELTTGADRDTLVVELREWIDTEI